MTDERSRIPVESEYVCEMGLALFAFAGCRWGAASCLQALSQEGARVPPSQSCRCIAVDLGEAVRVLGAGRRKDRLQDAQKAFIALVWQRRDLLTAFPSESPRGRLQLSSRGTPWSLRDLQVFGDLAAICAEDFRDILETEFG